jgi:hypothetical protein
MQAAWARVVTFAFAGLLTLALGCSPPATHTGPEETPTPSRTPTARDTTLLPSEPPPGFHLAAVELASADEDRSGANEYSSGQLVTLYGDPSLEDPATGPVLAAARNWGEDWAYLGCEPADSPSGVKTGTRSKHGPVVSCFGNLWVSWQNPTTDFTDEYVGVVGRNVSPELVARAADALSPPKGAVGVPHEPLEIPADVLPAGLKQLISGPVWGSSTDTPVSGDFFEWKRHRPLAYIDLSVTDASDELSLLTRVLVGGDFRRIRGGPGAIVSVRDSYVVTWREGDFLVGVQTYGVDRSTLDAFIRSLRKAPIDRAWELKDSFLTSPPATFLGPDEEAALAGRIGGQRWIVGVSTDGHHETILTITEDGDQGGKRGAPGRPGRDEIVAKRLRTDGGALIIFQVHKDVAKLVVTTHRDRKQIELPLARSVLPDGSRYAGTLQPGPTDVEFVTTYDSDGNVITRVAEEALDW